MTDVTNAKGQATRVSVEPVSVVAGEQVAVSVTSPLAADRAALQIEVYDTCRLNRTSKVGSGTRSSGSATEPTVFNLPTENLQQGIYEVGLVFFRNDTDDASEDRVVTQSGRDFQRCLFEVRTAVALPRCYERMLKEVASAEKALEARFFAPNDIRKDPTKDGRHYELLVFVEGLLIGTPVQGDQWEVFSGGRGLDSEDNTTFLNEFFTSQSPWKAEFEYSEPLRKRSRAGRPVSVFRFPNVVGENPETVRQHCTSFCERALLVYAMNRGARGHVFDIVVVDHETGAVNRYSRESVYRGNQLTGAIAGENPSILLQQIAALEANELHQFHVRLFAQALAEPNPEFQYVRYWQVLESLAEAKDYDPATVLIDDDGNEIRDENNQPIRVNGSVARVCALLRDSETLMPRPRWDYANMWFALRTAVGHYGAIDQHSRLARARQREWAERAIALDGGVLGSGLRTLRDAVSSTLAKELQANH